MSDPAADPTLSGPPAPPGESPAPETHPAPEAHPDLSSDVFAAGAGTEPSAGRRLSRTLTGGNGAGSTFNMLAAAPPGYEILAELGRGGMGAVYEARQINLNRVVALKTIPHAHVAGPGAVARFWAEAEVVAAVRHTHVVQVYEVGEHDGRPYMAMELCPGGTLAARPRPVPPRDAAVLVAKVARGVAAAHDLGIVHRDLKPGNVLLDAAGEPKVADFGLAKRAAVDLTATQATLGTPAYMAPEQAAGRAKFVGPPADVWALGVILYELVSGRRPFVGDGVEAVLLQVTQAEPPSVRTLNRTVPRDLDTVVAKCLAKEPHLRYPTAGELADDLDRFARGEPIAARPAGRAERGWRWCRRNPAVAGLLAALAVAVAVGLAGVTWKWREAARQRDEADAERTKVARLAAGLSLDRGLTVCESDPQLGLLLLAQSLTVAPTEEADLRRVIRTNLAAWAGWVHGLRGALPFPADPPGGPPVGLVGVAVGPDARTVAAVGADGAVWVWDAESGRPVARVAHPLGGRAVAFAAGGRELLTAGRDGTVRVWDAATGNPLATLGDPTNGPDDAATLAVSADSGTAAAGRAGGFVRVWDLAARRPRAEFRHPPGVSAVAVSPDGAVVATGGDDKAVRRWAADTGKPLGDPAAHKAVIHALAFTPDGAQVLSAGGDGDVKSWDAATGRPGRFACHQPLATYAVAVSADGSVVMTAGEERRVRIWDARTGRPVGLPLAQPRRVRGVALSRDGAVAVVAAEDGVVRLYHHPRADPPGAGWPVPFIVTAVQFSPDGRTLLTAGGRLSGQKGEARLWDARTGRPVGEPMRADLAMLAGAFSPDGAAVLTSGGDPFQESLGFARLWDAKTGRPLADPIPHPEVVTDAAFTPDGREFVTGCQDHRVRFRDLATGRPTRTVTHTSSVNGIAFTPAGDRLVTGDSDGAVGVYEVGTGRAVRPPVRAGGRMVMRVAVSPDGGTAVAGTAWQAAELWDVRTATPTGRLLRHERRGETKAAGDLPLGDWVRGAVFAPGGATVATGGSDGTVRLWDAGSGRSLGPPITAGGVLLTVAFDPDGRSVVAASANVLAGNSEVRRWAVPQPVPDDPAWVTLWVQVLTGMELDERGVPAELDPAAWWDRRRRLRAVESPGG